MGGGVCAHVATSARTRGGEGREGEGEGGRGGSHGTLRATGGLCRSRPGLWRILPSRWIPPYIIQLPWWGQGSRGRARVFGSAGLDG